MVSIIVPALNESATIDKTLANLQNQQGDHEVIVVDGGSIDDTLQIAASFPGVRCISSPKGRATQMNMGSEYANGDILLFLHADCLLPNDAIVSIEKILKDPSVGSGSFYIRFDSRHWLLNIYSSVSRINHPVFTYGDQGIFVVKELFRAIGGFEPMAMMEDVEIQDRLRKHKSFIKISKPIETSHRRFTSHGIFKQQIKNMVLIGLYRLGVSADVLKRYYPDPGTAKK